MVTNKGKPRAGRRQPRRWKIYIECERPVADWLPVHEAGETLHAVRKFYLAGRIVILEHHLSYHLGCWRGNLIGQGEYGKHDNRARHQRLLSQVWHLFSSVSSLIDSSPAAHDEGSEILWRSGCFR